MISLLFQRNPNSATSSLQSGNKEKQISHLLNSTYTIIEDDDHCSDISVSCNMNRLHQHDSLFKCTEAGCDKTYKSKTQLSTHLHRVHQPDSKVIFLLNQ